MVHIISPSVSSQVLHKCCLGTRGLPGLIKTGYFHPKIPGDLTSGEPLVEAITTTPSDKERSPFSIPQDCHLRRS